MISSVPISQGEEPVGFDEPTVCTYPVRLDTLPAKRKTPLVKIIPKEDCFHWRANHRHHRP